MKRRRKKAVRVTPETLEELQALFAEPEKKTEKKAPRVRKAKEEEPAAAGEMMTHDRWMREPLFDWLEMTFGKVRILEELEIGRSRADAVMVTEDAFVGIEIKSDLDTYARLARQVKDYTRYFERNYVVVGTSHAMHIEEHVPETWGIITAEEVDSAADFYLLRQAKENPERDLKCKLSLLWRNELDAVREGYVNYKYADKPRSFVAEKIIEKMPEDVILKRASEALFEREYRQ